MARRSRREAKIKALFLGRGHKTAVGPRLVRHVDKVRALRFSKDGKTLYSASSPGDTYRLGPGSRVSARDCRDRANRNLTQQEWEVTWPRTVSSKPGANFPGPLTTLFQPHKINALGRHFGLWITEEGATSCRCRETRAIVLERTPRNIS